jgi:hypothetical protein
MAVMATGGTGIVVVLGSGDAEVREGIMDHVAGIERIDSLGVEFERLSLSAGVLRRPGSPRTMASDAPAGDTAGQTQES